MFCYLGPFYFCNNPLGLFIFASLPLYSAHALNCNLVINNCPSFYGSKSADTYRVLILDSGLYDGMIHKININLKLSVHPALKHPGFID